MRKFLLSVVAVLALGIGSQASATVIYTIGPVSGGLSGPGGPGSGGPELSGTFTIDYGSPSLAWDLTLTNGLLPPANFTGFATGEIWPVTGSMGFVGPDFSLEVFGPPTHLGYIGDFIYTTFGDFAQPIFGQYQVIAVEESGQGEVPEPGTLPLLALGLFGAAWLARRQRTRG